MGVVVIWMNLDRKLVAGEEIFHEQGQIMELRILEPDFADPLAGRSPEDRVEICSTPWFFHRVGLPFHQWSFCSPNPSRLDFSFPAVE
jgi:hypothetical protein